MDDGHIRKIDYLSHRPAAPDGALIEAAARIIGYGGSVIFPTRSLYGLGVDALNPEAVRRVFTIKGRAETKPILVLIHEPEQLPRLVTHLPTVAEQLMERFWPGGLTLIMEAVPDLPEPLTAGTGKIGVRRDEHPVCAALTKAFGGPITGTSANRSGQSGAASISEIDAGVIAGVDLVLDAGELAGGVGSTILDVTGKPVRLIREGSVSLQAIREALPDIDFGTA